MKYAGTFLRIKNHRKYQHYKHRLPPWVKVHVLTLEDYDFARLQDASKWHAIGLLLLSTRVGNCFPDDPAWIAEKIIARSKVNLKALVSVGFLETCGGCEQCASKALAPCKQNGATETETETETETDQRAREGVTFDDFWSAYPRKAGKKAARKAFAKAKGELPANLLEIVAAHAASRQWRRDNGDYIPHPATWLNRGGWEDELPGAIAPAAASESGAYSESSILKRNRSLALQQLECAGIDNGYRARVEAAATLAAIRRLVREAGREHQVDALTRFPDDFLPDPNYKAGATP